MSSPVLDPRTLTEAISLSAHGPGKGVHSLTTTDTPHWFPLIWQTKVARVWTAWTHRVGTTAGGGRTGLLRDVGCTEARWCRRHVAWISLQIWREGLLQEQAWSGMGITGVILPVSDMFSKQASGLLGIRWTWRSDRWHPDPCNP